MPKYVKKQPVQVLEDGKWNVGYVVKYGTGRNCRKVQVYFRPSDTTAWYHEEDKDITPVKDITPIETPTRKRKRSPAKKKKKPTTKIPKKKKPNSEPQVKGGKPSEKYRTRENSNNGASRTRLLSREQQ